MWIIGDSMDLVTNLFFLILFGIIGFITDKIYGINPDKIYLDIGSMIFILLLYFLIPKETTDLNQSIDNIKNIFIFFTAALPGMVIGDLAGTVVSRLTEVLE